MTAIVLWSTWASTPDDLARAAPDDRVLTITDETQLAAASDAEIAFAGLNPERVKKLLAALPNLRWMHTPAAGVERIVDLPELRARGVMVTNNSGSYDAQIAEHVMACVFAASKRLHIYRDQQTRREWRDHPHTEVRGSVMVVYGMGSIGGEVARLAAAAGMRVIGVRRRAAPSPRIARVVEPEALGDVAAEADYLAICAPLTPATRGAVSRAVIARMKPTAWIVNIARGAIADEAALLEALRAGRLGGAAIDAFTVEPLPPDSPWWSLENVIVTPHASNSSPRLKERTLALFLENLRRYKAGVPLLNQVDFGAGY